MTVKLRGQISSTLIEKHTNQTDRYVCPSSRIFNVFLDRLTLNDDAMTQVAGPSLGVSFVVSVIIIRGLAAHPAGCNSFVGIKLSAAVRIDHFKYLFLEKRHFHFVSEILIFSGIVHLYK